MAFDEIIDKNVLQRLQDEYCEVTGLYVCCMDTDEHMISEISGCGEQSEQIAPYFQCREMKMALDRVRVGSLEEVAIETLEGGKGKTAAIAVCVRGEVVAYWLILNLFDVRNIRFARFEHALDLLRDAGNLMFESRLSVLDARVECRKNEDAYLKMEQSLATVEATTAVVQLLDSSDPIDLVMEQWLGIVCKHLDVDTAQIFSLHDDEKHMDVSCEWRKEGLDSFFAETKGIESYSFLYTDKPIVLSDCGGEGGAFGEEVEKVGIQSVMIFPILQQDNRIRMVLSLNHRSDHTFTMQEIKFAADVVKILLSIVTRRIQKNSLASSFAALEAVLDNVGNAIYVADKQTKRPLFANVKFRDSFEKEIEDNSFQRFLDYGVECAGEEAAAEVFYEEQSKWYDLRFKDITWVDGSTVTLYALYEITDKKIYQTRIEQQAHTDFLTGLYNRMCCERDLAKFIQIAEEEHQTGVLLYLDLDDFKHINDGLGHQYGDVLLKAVSRSFQEIEGISETCYRVGGDEFIVIIEPGSYSEMERILTDIRRIFSKPWFLRDTDYYCTMSMGIVQFPESGNTVIDLIQKADIAMYEAKKGGKNRVVRYDENIHSVSGRRLDMEKNMRDATACGYQEFVIYYQPIIDVEKEEIECAGAEALIRWNSSKLGFISPAEFIPLAEYLGLINPIGNYVLREACRHCRTWNDNGYPDYKVNVNLSVVQLLQPDIVEVVEKTIKESGINPKNLTLEVTESLAINDMEKMKKVLGGIKALGVKLALDDFGTGYSSLNHIREIPFDVIKVDQSFVKNLANDAYAKSFVKMVSELAETVGMNICVEGIETINQYAVLQGMKVKYIQGYFFDKPMPRDEFEAKYVQH